MLATACRGMSMTADEFKLSLAGDEPPAGMSTCLAALWWDAKGDWQRAHKLVDHLETREGMAVHAYLHRKEGDQSNASYWYRRSGRRFEKRSPDAEWALLLDRLLSAA
jgi:hypothetical protein